MLAGMFWVGLVAGGSAAVVIWALAVRLAYGLAVRRKAGVAARLLVAFWPFGARQAAGVPADISASLNKMLVAFFLALLVAISSMAVYSNLTFVPPAHTQ